MPISFPQLTGTQVAAVTSLALGGVVRTPSPIAEAMKQLTQPVLLPIPARVLPYRITGTTRYLDPTWGGPFNGTFTQPYNSPTQATLAAGDGLLFRAGTTTTITTAIAPAVTGTSIAPIVFGVYDGASTATDKRIYGRQGMATVSCNGLAISGFNASGRNFVCIDGLRVTTNTGANNLINFSSSDSLQILNCIATSSVAGAGIYVNGGNNHAIEGNAVNGVGHAGIVFQNQSNAATTSINFNTVRTVGDRGIWVYDGYNGIAHSGTIACNTVSDCGVASSVACIVVLTGGGAVKIYRNDVRRSRNGVMAVSSLSGSTLTADFSGMVIENNYVANTEFNIYLFAAGGTWLAQYNTVVDAGSLTGSTWVSSDKYGRNFELFGPSEASACRDGTIRFNYVSGAYNWPTPASQEGSEGVGIGIDDKSRNIQVYGNYCVSNEGHGIQSNSGWANSIHGNVCVDNVRPRPGRGVTIREQDQAQITYVLTPGVLIYNNTCVSTGQPNQKYGISEAYSGNPSPNGRVFNNLLIGSSVAGLRLDETGASATENSNVVVGSPSLVLNISGGATSAGAGTVSASVINVGADAPLYQPASGSACSGTGVVVPGSAVSFAGWTLAANTPIGALHAA